MTSSALSRSSSQSRLRPWLIASTLVAAAFGASITVGVAPAGSQGSSASAAHPQPGITGQLVVGKADFDEYCAGCHGTNGGGNGPTTSVIPGIKPPDLTKIAAANGGVFPADKVADMIDGRKSIPSHQRFDMPFWGVNFQQPGGKEFTPESEAWAKARIDAIVAYISRMQTK